MTEIAPPPRRRLGAPIWLQMLGLLLGGLIAAQVVTLTLTVLLPPEPPQQHSLDEIAVALKGGALAGGAGRPLIRSQEAAPPSLQSPGWVVSERSTAELVKLVGAGPGDLRLLFYAPPPLAGTAPSPPRGLPPAAHLDRPQVRLASFALLDQGPPAAARGGSPPPPATLEDGRRGPMPQGARGVGGRRLGGLGGAAPSGSPGAGGLGRERPAVPFGGFQQGPPQGRRGGLQAPLSAGAVAPGDQALPQSGLAGAPMRGGGAAFGGRPTGAFGQSPAGPGGPPPGGFGQRPGGLGAMGVPRLAPRDELEAAAFDADRRGPVRATEPPPVAAQPARAAPESLAQPPQPVLPDVSAPAPPAAIVGAVRAIAAPTATPVVVASVQPAPPERALAPPQRAGVFGLGRASYVEGEFVAALRAADGRWTTVRPQPEGFPNSWQRRVLLWFGLAFAIVAPLGVLLARRLAAPLYAFADAAERLGRDPSADIALSEGPAEVGRAAIAFNQMQRRLKRYIDDRTGMIGAISHDLRTPLARMRFKLERLPPATRASLDRDIRQMEEMIDSVLSFMRGEAEPVRAGAGRSALPAGMRGRRSGRSRRPGAWRFRGDRG